MSVRYRNGSGFTLMELLCVIAIIAILAAMVSGPAMRVLQRVRADQWSEQAHKHLHSIVEKLNQQFQGKHDFPLVTLERIEAGGWLREAELRFLRDPDVTFSPFEGADSPDKVVIQVQLRRGFWWDAGVLTRTKEALTRLPD